MLSVFEPKDDPYFKKVVTLRHQGHTMQLRVAQDLFSSHEVDVGTRFLLRTLAQPGTGPFHKILDLGCGYGPLGLALKKLYPQCIVHLVDRDALAVDYSRQNADLNGLSDVQVYSSLGYDDVRDRDYDLVLANLPAKAGEGAITHFVLEAARYLTLTGMVAVVVVAPLGAAVAAALESSSNVDLIHMEARPGHAVFHYRFSSGPGEQDYNRENSVERGVYHRGEIIVRLGGVQYYLSTANGLPEFDTPSHSTEFLVEELRSMGGPSPSRAVVFNPRQGHVAVALWKLLGPAAIELVDRDLLALRYSRRNLLLNGCPEEHISVSHLAGVSGRQQHAGLVIVAVREEEGAGPIAATLRQAAGRLSPGGAVLAAGSSTAITRLERLARSENLGSIERRRRRRGGSLMVLRWGTS